jgi:lysozyme
MIDWHDYCLPLIKQWEGCDLTAYPDPATGGEPWTIGYGATGPDIESGTVWTQEQADADLAQRVEHINAIVTQAVRVRLSPQERAALVSLAYNVGTSAFLNSTLLKALNDGDYNRACGQFGVWIIAAGRVLAGLIRRRAAEAELFAEGIA